MRKPKPIDEFCAHYDISRSFYYKLRNSGKGPAEIAIGSRILITPEAEDAWLEARRAEAATRTRGRRSKIAARAA